MNTMNATQKLHGLGQSLWLDNITRNLLQGGLLRRSGIDLNALATRLQDEGAASFVKSWNELMAVIVSKSAALQEPSSR
jgi:hypothetical protein